MKLRMHEDSLRLRLDRQEVDALARGECVRSQARLPTGSVFGWRLAGEPEFRVALVQGELTIAAPVDALGYWATTETEVSLRAAVPTPDGGQLAVLIEKDFECLEPREGESQSNRFANPKKTG